MAAGLRLRLDRACPGRYTTCMSEPSDDPKIEPTLVSETLRRAIGERYLTYALSTIMHRALPDARDGLKPVHRRILFAMRELRLSPTGGLSQIGQDFRRCDGQLSPAWRHGHL